MASPLRDKLFGLRRVLFRGAPLTGDPQPTTVNFLGVGVSVAYNAGAARFDITIGSPDYIDLPPIAEPPAPASGFREFCDAADGKLKAKSAAGHVRNLADP